MKYIFSPKSYLLLLKSDLHQEHNLFNQDHFPDKVALGGVYESIDEDEEFIYTKRNGKILKESLIPYEEGKYSFRIGDIVIFSPICDKQDVKSLT